MLTLAERGNGSFDYNHIAASIKATESLPQRIGLRLTWTGRQKDGRF